MLYTSLNLLSRLEPNVHILHFGDYQYSRRHQTYKDIKCIVSEFGLRYNARQTTNILIGAIY